MLGVSSSWLAIQGFGIRESVEKIFDLGFDLVELGAAHRYEENAIDTIRQIRKKYSDKKFTIHALFPPPKDKILVNLASENPEKVFQINKGLIELAKELNALVVGIHGGYAGEVSLEPGDKGFSKRIFKSEMDVEEARRNTSQMLQRILNVAEEHKVKLAVENDDPSDSTKLLILKPDDFQWVFSQFDSPMFGALLDMGHLYITSKVLGFDYYEALESVDKIFEIHLHDVKGTGGHWDIGSGEIDFERTFDIIRPKINNIPIIFEHHSGVTAEDVLKEKEYIENLLKQ